MSTDSLNQLYQHLCTQLVEAQACPTDLPSWWQRVQQKARETFIRTGIPSNKSEDYRYTPIAKRLAALFAKAKRVRTSRAQAAPSLDLIGSPWPGYHVVLYNGRLQQLPSLPHGLRIEPAMALDGVVQRQMQTQMTGAYFTEGDPWIALNGACVEEALVLALAPNTKLAQPIYLHYYMEAFDPSIFYQRTFFHLQRASQAKVVVLFYAPNLTPLLYNHVGGIHLDVGASLQHYSLQVAEAPAAHLLNYHLVSLEEKSQFHQYTLTHNLPFVRNQFQVDLQGTHSEARLYGSYLGQDKAHIENHHRLVHKAVDTKAQVRYKGVVGDQSSGVFHSLAEVRPHAQKTETSQYHHGWLWDDRARIYARPQLAIEANDVICRHGATMATPDEAVYFYLQARGIDRQKAKQLLLYAFLAEAMHGIPDKSLQGHVEDLLQAICLRPPHLVRQRFGPGPKQRVCPSVLSAAPWSFAGLPCVDSPA